MRPRRGPKPLGVADANSPNQTIMKITPKRQKKKFKFYQFENWRVVIACEDARNSGTRSYPKIVHWYAFPADSESSELRFAVHQGNGGINRAEIKLASLNASAFDHES